MVKQSVALILKTVSDEQTNDEQVLLRYEIVLNMYQFLQHTKFVSDGKVQIGEVRYYFSLSFGDNGGEYPLALLSVYSNPDRQILEESFGTNHIC